MVTILQGPEASSQRPASARLASGENMVRELHDVGGRVAEEWAAEELMLGTSPAGERGMEVSPAGRIAHGRFRWRLRVRFVRLCRAGREPPRLWQEFVLLVLGGTLYALIQGSLPASPRVAMGRGRSLLAAERYSHIDVEHFLNAALSRWTWLAQCAGEYYVMLHFLIPAVVLIWLACAHGDRYRRERQAFVVLTLIGLACFWLVPTAPPRLLTGGGFIDTIVQVHLPGGYSSSLNKYVADDFASMPSLHLAWALWCACTLFRVGRRRPVRYAAFTYPLLTAVDVLATGNHYLLDLVAGAVALAGAYALTEVAAAVGRRVTHADALIGPAGNWLKSASMPARPRDADVPGGAHIDACPVRQAAERN